MCPIRTCPLLAPALGRAPAARDDHVRTVIRPAVVAGKWVVCDRFIDSTYAYQGAARGLARETVSRIESVAVGDFKPDLTLILDLPVDEGLRRANARAHPESRYEKFEGGFHENLRRAFLDLAKAAPERCVVIDASKGEDEIASAIWAVVAQRFGIG